MFYPVFKTITDTPFKNVRRRAMLAIVALFSLSFIHPSHSQSALLDSDLVFPSLTGRVIDRANLLNSSQQARLEAQLESHEHDTGNQVVVATVATLNGMEITEYSRRLANKWQLGQAGRDNGVLILVAPDQREIRIEVGRGLENQLSDTYSRDIIQTRVLPSFREEDYAIGIAGGVDAVLSAIDGNYVFASEKNGSSFTQHADHKERAGKQYFPLLFIAFIGMGHILKRRGMDRLSGGVFPAGFFGIAATAITGKLILGVLASVVIFCFIYFFGARRKHNNQIDGYHGNSYEGGRPFHPHPRYDKHGRRYRHQDHRYADNEDRKLYHEDRPVVDHHHSEGSGNGGFGGGGGSFGGGGASGRW